MRQAAAPQFARAAGIYWLEIFPLTRRERRVWEGRAETIPDPALRHDAQFTLRTKWGHSEGAAALATLVPRAYRRRVVRMAIAYQSIVDYLDTTSERRVDDPFANTFRLHQALFAALGVEPGEKGDYYALHPQREDGGYLASQAEACREIFATLPSAPAVAGAARRFATLYAEAQGLCHSLEAGIHDTGGAEQTRIEASLHPELQWGEMLAAGSSSLPVLVLLALAGKPGLSEREVDRVAAAYYPWISSLHILLHGVVDQAADRAGGQFNQLNHYPSVEDATGRVTLIASHARSLALHLPQGDLHTAILAGMGGYYLSPPQAWEPESAEISQHVLDSLGPFAKTALFVHRARRWSGLRPLNGRRGPSPASSPHPR